MADLDPGAEFRRLFERTGRSLLAQAYVLTGDRQESQDLVQEAFLRAWRDWARVLDPRQSAGLAPPRALQPLGEPLAESHGQTLPRSALAHRCHFAGTGRRAPRCHEGPSVVAHEAASGSRAGGDRRHDDRTSGAGDGGQRGHRSCLGLPGARDHGALVGPRCCAGDWER